MFTIVRRYRERRAARARYDKHVDFAHYLLWDEDYSDPQRRIENLGLLAYTHGCMAREVAVFGGRLADDNGDTPEAGWHQTDASLFLLVLAAETGDYGEVALDETANWLYQDHQIRSVLGGLAGQDDVRAKGHALIAFADEMLEQDSQRASDAIAVLAHAYFTSSGMTIDEAHQTVWGIPVAR